MPNPRSVLAAIDLVDVVRERHPQLFAEHLRRDRSCGQLARAWERYRTDRGEPVGGRVERDEVEAPDSEWVEAEARRREELFAGDMRQRAVQIRERRRHMTLVQRLHATEIERHRLSTVAAASTGSARGHATSALPPRQDLLDFTEDDWWIERGLAGREAKLDELAGLGPARDIAGLLAVDKDRMLVSELAHLTPAEIEVAYTGRLGSAETVRRVRRRARRNSDQMAALRAQGWTPGEIRERLGLSDDDEIVAKEWASAHES